MEKNNGFTLVELLVTIALIATLSVVVGLSVNNLLASQDHKDYDAFKKDVEDAACVFVQSDSRTSETCPAGGSSCHIMFSDLIKYGLIRKTMQNPMTDEAVIDDTESYIDVTYVNGEKFCKLVDKKCDDEYCKE